MEGARGETESNSRKRQRALGLTYAPASKPKEARGVGRRTGAINKQRARKPTFDTQPAVTAAAGGQSLLACWQAEIILSQLRLCRAFISNETVYMMNIVATISQIFDASQKIPSDEALCFVRSALLICPTVLQRHAFPDRWA